MSVIRVNKNKNYTTMSNYHFKDKRISLKAKGLLSQMLSLPENWDYSLQGLVAINKENLSAVKSALGELREFGYVEITKQMPNETKSGRIEYVYDIYEYPKQEGEKQGAENLQVENLSVEVQSIEKPLQLNTNNKTTYNKKTNNKINNIYNDEFEQIWKEYPRKQGKSVALKAYIKARKNGVDKDTILTGIKNYVNAINQNKTERKYIKQGSTWFNQECWNDEYNVKPRRDDLDDILK